MGWDYTHATHYTRTGAIDKKAEIDEALHLAERHEKI